MAWQGRHGLEAQRQSKVRHSSGIEKNGHVGNESKGIAPRRSDWTSKGIVARSQATTGKAKA